MNNPTERRQELYRLLGDLPEKRGPVAATLVNEERRGDYVVETLALELNGIETVPAYFVRPVGASGRLPTILYNHAHGGNYHIGKEELLSGVHYIHKPPYAEALTRNGYAALCIDQWVFGERRGRTESEVFKETLWTGRVLWGMMVYDSLRAVDYLMTRPDVDTQRIGTLGTSMGSTMAWWIAALDERIRVCVDICCLTEFHTLVQMRRLDLHGLFYYVPGLLKHFTTAQINALIAPRPHLGLAGLYDPATPPEGLDLIDRELRQVYAAAGAADAWKLIRYNCGHIETADMRRQVVAFLNHWLRDMPASR